MLLSLALAWILHFSHSVKLSPAPSKVLIHSSRISVNSSRLGGFSQIRRAWGIRPSCRGGVCAFLTSWLVEQQPSVGSDFKERTLPIS